MGGPGLLLGMDAELDRGEEVVEGRMQNRREAVGCGGRVVSGVVETAADFGDGFVVGLLNVGGGVQMVQDVESARTVPAHATGAAAPAPVVGVERIEAEAVRVAAGVSDDGPGSRGISRRAGVAAAGPVEARGVVQGGVAGQHGGDGRADQAFEVGLGGGGGPRHAGGINRDAEGSLGSRGGIFGGLNRSGDDLLVGRVDAVDRRVVAVDRSVVRVQQGLLGGRGVVR